MIIYIFVLVIWIVTLCNCVGGYCHFKGIYCHHLQRGSENRNAVFICNIGNHPPHYVVL